MRLKYSFMLGAAASAAAPFAGAAELAIGVEVPQLNVAEYHRPYVSMWIERKDQSFVGNLAVWHKAARSAEGDKWLKDLRTWWRKSGRELKIPVDGVTSATRPVGAHRVAFTEGSAPFGKLAAGEYRLVVEAVRENGGREIVTLPFQWPPQGAGKQQLQGKDELGLVTLELKP
jgi:hypothetical protein